MKRQELETIVFDFDGTLVNSQKFLPLLYSAVRQEAGLPELSSAELERYSKLGLKSLVGKFRIKPWKLPKLVKLANQALTEVIDQLEFEPGWVSVLDSLKQQGLQLGILTSNTRENVKQFLKLQDCSVFEFIYNERSLFSKARVMEKMIGQEDLRKESMLYVGDQVRDVEACQQAGVRSVAVSWGYAQREVLLEAQPDFLIDKPSELLDIVS